MIKKFSASCLGYEISKTLCDAVVFKQTSGACVDAFTVTPAIPLSVLLMLAETVQSNEIVGLDI